MARTLLHTPDDEASMALAAADPELGALIRRISRVEVAVTGGGFEVMAESIVSQQLSAKAAATIWRKLTERVGVSAEALAAATSEELRAAGLSRQKIDYVTGLARATLSGNVDFDELEELDDDQVIDRLVSLRGVGRWTAEMYLLFGMGRPDVLALDDLGIRISAGRMAGLAGPMPRQELADRGERWRPWRSAASLWLWAEQG